MQLSGAVIWDALMLIFFAICLVAASKIPRGLTLGLASKEVGSALWPQILFVVLVVLAGAQLWVDARAQGDKGGEGKAVRSAESRRFFRATVMVLLAAAFISLQRVVGFLVAMFLFVAGMLLIAGYKNKVLLLVASIVISMALTAIFGRGLYTPLPKGLGVFRTLSSLIY